jgi:drug/metabolite transporter (DMT)-like permease
MTPAIVTLFFFTIILDVVGQLCFKLGLMRLPEKQAADRLGVFWKRVFTSPLLWGGIASYAVELGLWLAVLANAPLSLVFPLASLSYCGVVLASRFVLKETVSRQRWAGAMLIALGVACVYMGARG